MGIGLPAGGALLHLPAHLSAWVSANGADGEWSPQRRGLRAAHAARLQRPCCLAATQVPQRKHKIRVGVSTMTLLLISCLLAAEAHDRCQCDVCWMSQQLEQTAHAAAVRPASESASNVLDTTDTTDKAAGGPGAPPLARLLPASPLAGIVVTGIFPWEPDAKPGNEAHAQKKGPAAIDAAPTCSKFSLVPGDDERPDARKRKEKAGSETKRNKTTQSRKDRAPVRKPRSAGPAGRCPQSHRPRGHTAHTCRLCLHAGIVPPPPPWNIEISYWLATRSAGKRGATTKKQLAANRRQRFFAALCYAAQRRAPHWPGQHRAELN